MMHSVADIAGVNAVTRVVLENAACAVAGMADGWAKDATKNAKLATQTEKKPTLGINTTIETMHLHSSNTNEVHPSTISHAPTTSEDPPPAAISTNPSDEPSMWAISFQQLLDVKEECMKMFSNDFESKTMRDVNSEIIIPVCRETGKSYALTKNPQGLRTEVFVSTAGTSLLENSSTA